MITIRNLNISSQRFEKLIGEAFVEGVANRSYYKTQFTFSINFSDHI